MKRVATILRKVSELHSDELLSGFSDPDQFCVFKDCRLKTFEENPFLKSQDEVGQIVGALDNRIIGGIAILPLEYKIDNQIVRGVTGNWLFVNPEFRSTMYSTRVMAMLPTMYEYGLGTGGAIVDSAAQIEKSLGYTVWNPTDFHYVRTADDFLTARMPGLKGKLCAKPINIILWFQRKCADMVASYKTMGLSLCDLDCSDNKVIAQVARFVAADKHRFSEVHDERWFKWVLSHDTIKYYQGKRQLVGLKVGDDLVGFFMLSYSSTACRIVEWQVPESVEDLLPYLMIKVAKRYLKNLNHVAIILDDEKHVATMRRFGFFRSNPGASSIMIASRSKASEVNGIKDWHLWRRRPAMADASLL